MALSKGQRALIAKRVGRDNGGGEAYRQWQDDPGANWAPPSRNGSVQGRSLPNARGSQTHPIPNSSPLRNGMTQRGKKRYA